MLGFVADSQYGISRKCACGGRIIDEVRGKEDYDTLPGKRFFTCINYEDDGLHYRHPWVFGVQEEIERLTTRVEEAEQVIKLVANLNKQIETVDFSYSTDTPSYISNMLPIRNQIRDQQIHDRLKADLAENIWQKFDNLNE
ncbi:hypothetical protein Bca4012_078916 [Brassica carinata]